MNLFLWMGRFSQVLERPFTIGWTPYTLKYMLVGLLLYGCGIALYYSSRENRRPGEEYGSAKWGSPKELNRKYMDHRHKDANIILTQRVRLGMDGYISQRNMNVLVVGGSGSGKTRFFCKPNIYSANCSYLITDPKGELLRAAGALLAAQGYEVRVFNLIDPSQSDGYNPFSYIHSEKDVLTLIDIQTTQEVEIYFNFVGKFVPPAFGEVELTPEELEEIRKREERKDKLHQNYLKRKASGAQKRYEDKVKAKKKAEIDAKKAAIRAEDIARGVFVPVSSLPQREPQKGAQTA